MEKNLFSMATKKSVHEFIQSLKENAGRFNFGVRHIFEMKEEYKGQGVDVDDDFRLYQVIICNFKRSYNSMKKNMERASVLLQPKQVIVYTGGEGTIVNYLPFSREFIKQALPQDKEFHNSLFESCQKVIELIKISG